MSQDISEVREEDVFDVVSLHAWLSQRMDTSPQLPKVKQFRSGASNLTYLLSYPESELILRLPPKGSKAASAHDMKREFFIQEKLKPVFYYVPKVLALCEDHNILGTDFYVMEKIEGTILRRDLPKDLDLPTEEVAAIGEKVVSGLVELHSVDASILANLNKGSGYVSRQVEGWSRRYRDALTDDVPLAEELMLWLEKNQPDDVASCVIHGDWRLDNMVFDLNSTPRLVGVLDWELATVGDPLMDLGSSLAYWIDRDDEPSFSALRRQPSNLPGMPTRKEFVDKYLSAMNLPCDDFTFYEVFGLFRLTVIAQQIWYRYRLGQTTNPSFSQFGAIVNLLIDRANRLTL